MLTCAYTRVSNSGSLIERNKFATYLCLAFDVVHPIVFGTIPLSTRTSSQTFELSRLLASFWNNVATCLVSWRKRQRSPDPLSRRANHHVVAFQSLFVSRCWLRRRGCAPRSALEARRSSCWPVRIEIGHVTGERIVTAAVIKACQSCEPDCRNAIFTVLRMCHLGIANGCALVVTVPSTRP